MVLTHAAISAMVRSEPNDPCQEPIIQIINIKRVTGGGNDRFRSILSDGEHYVQGMLATQLNKLVTDGELQENSIIKVEEFMNNKIQDRTVIIVLKLSVVQRDRSDRIGQPVDIEKSGVSRTRNHTAPAQPMYNPTNSTAATNGLRPPSSSNPYGGGSQPSRPTNYSAPIVRAPVSSQHYTSIAQLNMYQNRWTIRARVTSKSDIRTWSNARGEGSLFSIDLLDASGVDIRGTFFKEAVDKFYHILEINKVYTFSGGRLKVANMKFNQCKSNFEITFDTNSEIHLVNDTGDILQQMYDFVKIADIEAMEADKMVDILGVVKTVGDPVTLVSKKTGKELTKCDLSVGDDSGVDINVTMWGNQAHQASSLYNGQPVVAFRRLRISDFNGKSLSASGGSSAVPSPPVPEAAQIQQWWSSGGGQANTSRSLSSSGGGSSRVDPFAQRKVISKIKSDHLGMNSEKPDYLTFKGTVTFLKKDKEGGAWYPACPKKEDPCRNLFKVTQTTDQNWFCDKCQGTYPNCVRRWIFSGTVTDDTSTTWVSLFNEQAEVLLGGAKADDVYRETMAEEHDQDKYDSFFARATYGDWIFKCKVKQEQVGDETRVKTSVASMQPVDYAKECREMLDVLAKI